MSKLREFLSELEVTELTDFERDYLIPETIARISFYLDYFKRLIPICENLDNAILIDGAVRKVVADPNIDPSVPTPEVGKQYLNGIKNQIQAYWITNLSDFLDKYSSSESINDQKEMLRFAQRAQALSSSIVSCKTKLLSFSFRAYPLIYNIETREQMYGIPQEIEILAYPFLGALAEMESSASALIQSFQNWRENKMEARKDYAKFLLGQKEYEAATLLAQSQHEYAMQQGDKQILATKQLNIFQVLVIIFTIVLTLCSNELIEFCKELAPIIRSWFP